jgi:periplasmic protein TonB
MFLIFVDCIYIEKNSFMRLLLFVVCSFLAVNSFAQKTPPPPPEVWDTSAIIFTKIDIEASVDRQQWIDHLTKNLQSVIERAARKGMKAGTYIVQVKFLVERDGSISDVQALNDPGFGLAKAAVKALKTGPKWTPGEQNGKKVRSYHTQPITFVIQEQ